MKRWFFFLFSGFLLLTLLVIGLTSCEEEEVKTEAIQLSEEQKPRVYTNKEDNAACLVCHASRQVRYTNDSLGIEFRQKMYQECVIDTVAYYNSNHWNFKCTDCHSEDYLTFPHNPQLRFEEIPGCLDCHGDDPTYAQFHFENIQEQFDKSVHSSRHSDEFSCYSCHDSHYYLVNARNRQQNIKMTIAYDNAICLSCHADVDNYQMIIDRLNPNVTKTHSWLPNQANHFLNVRCIECHVEVQDSTLVGHNILPKEKAVKLCVECHSTDSRLKATLYKYTLEGGSTLLRDATMGDAVLIGASRSTSINILSNVLLLMTLAGLLFHMFLRIINRNKKQHG